MAGGAYGIDEVFLTPFGPIETGVAGVTEIREAAFEEMFGGEMADGGIVGLEPGERWNEAGGADIDDWNFKRAEGFGDGGIFDAGDDAGAVPGGEPGGSFVAAGVFGEIDGPRAAFLDVTDDAAEEAARVGVRGLDEQCDFGGGIQFWERETGRARIVHS